MRQPKTSIYNRILTAFSVVAGVLFLVGAAMIGMQAFIINRYDLILKNLMIESRFIQEVPEMVNSYYSVVLSAAASRERLDAYNDVKNTIQNDIAVLDSAIVNEQSRVNYLGIKNLINLIIDDCEEGIRAALEGNLVLASQRYDEALNKNYFLERSVGTLVLSEMRYAETLSRNLHQIRQMGLYFSLSALVLAILGVALFSRNFAKNLSSPLVEMAGIARRIEKEDFDFSINPEIIERRDELGILGNTFKSMASRLKSDIAEIRRSNQELMKTQKVLEEKNEELKKMNSFMIGRELKMVELKKRIKELEGEPGAIKPEKQDGEV